LFLDKCGETEEFRLAVKRTKPVTLQEAVTNAMQEEYLRIGERELAQEKKPAYRPVHGLDDGGNDSNNGYEPTNRGYRRPNLMIIVRTTPGLIITHKDVEVGHKENPSTSVAIVVGDIM